MRRELSQRRPPALLPAPSTRRVTIPARDRGAQPSRPSTPSRPNQAAQAAQAARRKPGRPVRRDLREGNEPGEDILLLTVPQAMRRLNCGRRFIYERIKSGELASVKLGSYRRIPVSALDDFVAAIVARSSPVSPASRSPMAQSGKSGGLAVYGA